MGEVRLGLIGCGNHVRTRVRHLADGTGASIIAVADPSEEMRSAIGVEAQRFADHGAMLEAVELDGVVISSPHGLHYGQAAAALLAGCHVLVYKPMVTTSADARELVRLADESCRVVSLAVEGLFTAEYRHVRALLDAGELGEIRLVTGTVAQDWFANVGGTWRTDPVLGGGGNLIDSGYHLLAALLHLTGQRPVEVFAYLDRRDERVDVETAATLRFDGGALGTIAVSGDAQGMEEGIYLCGTKVSLTTSVYGGRLAFVTGWSERDVLELEPAETAEANFVRCIRGEAETLAPPGLGLELARVVEAIVRSAEEHAPVQVARG
ncbi:MAG TPA: Gfo/Idh/MocA family oxidoreductase [Gaiellaceae bacterium]|jgi:predicted dehydrogenase